MEGLIVLALFIIFSIIKQFLEKGKAPVPGERGKRAPLPREEEGEDMPLPRERWERKKPPEKAGEREGEKPPSLSSGLGREISDSGEGAWEKRPSPGRKTPSGMRSFEGQNLVQGVVFSEVLGPPRSRKPFSIKQMNKVYKD